MFNMTKYTGDCKERALSHLCGFVRGLTCRTLRLCIPLYIYLYLIIILPSFHCSYIYSSSDRILCRTLRVLSVGPSVSYLSAPQCPICRTLRVLSVVPSVSYLSDPPCPMC